MQPSFIDQKPEHFDWRLSPVLLHTGHINIIDENGDLDIYKINFSARSGPVTKLLIFLQFRLDCHLSHVGTRLS